MIIESCIDSSAKAARWKNKLKNFIDNKSDLPQKYEETNRGCTTHVKPRYFEYNPVDSIKILKNNTRNKSIEIIKRAKFI